MALSGKRILITGGAGFIGTTLARRLVDGNQVVALDNLHRDVLANTPVAKHPNFELHRADVLDGDTVRELARGATHIVHAAAIAGVDTVRESPVRTMRVNLIGTYNVLEGALATRETVERLVDFSTSEIFGTHAYNVGEGHVSTIGSVGEVRWTYAVSKLAGEHMAHAYREEHGIPVVTVRPFNVYGPGQIGGGAIRAFIEAALARRGRRPDVQRRQRPLGRDDLRPRATGQADHRCHGRDRLPAAPLRRRRAPDPERREGARGARLRGEGRPRRGPGADDCVVQRTDAGTELIRLAWPDMGAAEAEAVAEVLETGQLTMGPKVAEFERGLAERCGTDYAVALSSGTAALHLAVLALGIGPGDEVLVPAYTFPATANVVALAGAKPVLVDVDQDTMNLDTEKLLVGPKTRAIIAVDLFGRPARIEQLPEGVPVLEDAAGALGAQRRGRPCGSLGVLACLSFHPRKIVTTGEGGAVTTDDPELADAIRRMRPHGIEPRGAFEIAHPGLNYRLSDILCAVGIPQLARLDQLLEARTRIAAGYAERLRDLVDPPTADRGDVHG